MFCEKCTLKRQIKDAFKRKGKTEPVRVCVGCYHVCLTRKVKVEVEPGLDEQKHIQLRSIIYVPDYDPTKFEACHKCCKPGKSGHHCRTCGRQFCKECVSKVDTPPAYQKNKKAKLVCDNCRYLIVRGARLLSAKHPTGGIDLPIQKVDPVLLSSSTKKRGSSASNAETKVRDSVDLSAAVNAVSMAAAGTALGTGTKAVEDKPYSLAIKWENDHKRLAALEITTDTRLNVIDSKFRRQNPLKSQFAYLCRETMVPKVFWDLFPASVLGPTLHIRKVKTNAPNVAPRMTAMAPRMTQARKTAFAGADVVVYKSPYRREENAASQAAKGDVVVEQLFAGEFRAIGQAKAAEIKKTSAAAGGGTHFDGIGLPPGIDEEMLAIKQRTADEKAAEMAMQKSAGASQYGDHLMKPTAGQGLGDLLKARAAAYFG